MSTHFYTIDETEAVAATANMVGNSEGAPFNVVTSSSSTSVPMYRSMKQGKTFLTAFIDERDISVNEDGYGGAGIAFWCLPAGNSDGVTTLPLFRGYDPVADLHIYSLDMQEVSQNGFFFESIAGSVWAARQSNMHPLRRVRTLNGSTIYVTTDRKLRPDIVEAECGYVFTDPPPDPSPMYRAYNPATGGHLYTMNIDEYDTAQAGGYRGDGIGFYLYSAAPYGEGAAFVKLLRCYSAASDDHLYTTDQDELTYYTGTMGYADEGVAGWVNDPRHPSFLGVPMTPCQRIWGYFKDNFFLLPIGYDKGLTSNSNYVMASTVAGVSNPILGLSVRIDITEEIIIKSNTQGNGKHGFTFQLNCFSEAGYVSAFQQYCFDVIDGFVGWTVNNYSGDEMPPGKKIPRDIDHDQRLCTTTPAAGLFPFPNIDKGWTLTIELLYEQIGLVTGATFSAFYKGKLIAKKDALIDKIKNGKELGYAPIVACQLVMVGYANGSQTVFKPGGAGSFTFNAESPLVAQLAFPPNAQTAITVETANSVYGEISTTKSKTLVQGFTTNGTTF